MKVGYGTVERRRETRLHCPCPLGIWIISCNIPPLDKMSQWLLDCSSLKKSNNLCRETGSQTEVAALNTIPSGSPGSLILFRVKILTSSLTFPATRLPQLCKEEAQTPEQKLSTIRRANFNMLFLPPRFITVSL